MNNTPKNLPFTFARCLRHAFMTGAGYGDFDKISEDDQKRWVEYNPDDASFRNISAALRSAAETPAPPPPETHVMPAANEAWATACVNILWTKSESYKLYYEVKAMAEAIERGEYATFDAPAPEPNLQGWTGNKCEPCKGHGVRMQDGEERRCPDCAGTGDEYGALSDPTDEINPYEQALRDAVEPFLDWLEQREEGAHIKEVREGLIGVEDVIPDDHVVLGAHLRAQKDQGVLTIGHFRRLQAAYDGNASPSPETKKPLRITDAENAEAGAKAVSDLIASLDAAATSPSTHVTVTDLTKRLRSMRSCTVCEGDGTKSNGKLCGGCGGVGDVHRYDITGVEAANEIDRAHAALRALMAKLADLLDEDHFADCEEIVRKVGIAPSPQSRAVGTPVDNGESGD